MVAGQKVTNSLYKELFSFPLKDNPFFAKVMLVFFSRVQVFLTACTGLTCTVHSLTVDLICRVLGS